MNSDCLYESPDLYEAVLPEYKFSGLPDAQLLRREVARLLKGKSAGKALEIGCGTGRLTGVLLDFASSLVCVDISEQMLSTFRLRYPDVRVFTDDAHSFVVKSGRLGQAQFDLITACWSLNYPLLDCFERNTGQAIETLDLKQGLARAHSFLSGLIKLLSPGGHLLALFFDPESVEQKFVTSHWERVAPFPGTGRDFTRRVLLDFLAGRGGETVYRHYVGRMKSRSLDTAEQWFVAGHFKNFRPLIDEPAFRQELRDFLRKHGCRDGSVEVEAGVYVVAFTASASSFGEPRA